jgi:hypothetical protein
MTRPIIIVFKGTKEFNIEAIVLSTSVSANANKKDGKKVPRKPERASHFHCFLVMFFNEL